MDKKDKKDQIILQQLEVIQTLTEHNLRRMGSDFWGGPEAPRASEPKETPAGTPKAPPSPAAPAASTSPARPPWFCAPPSPPRPLPLPIPLPS